MRVGWSAPTSGATKYYVYRRIARYGYGYAKIATTYDTYYYDLVADLNPGTEYYYRVKAVNRVGDTGPWLNYGAITTPTQETILPAYNIYRRIARDGYQYTRIATTSENYFYELLAGLNPGTEYYYRVRAVNSVGQTGPLSNYGAITTPTQ